MQSACYTRSGGALSCSTCHDPHARASSDVPAYEAVCLSCHGPGSKSKQVACPISPAAKCIDCHMPRRELGGNSRFTDHWIRKPDPAAAPGGDRPPAAAVPAADPAALARAAR